MDAPFSFNRSVRIGSRRDRITGDSGALTGRELLRRSGVVRFLAKGLPDKRDGRRIRHSQRRLARTLLLLAGQGRREHSDATALRDDPALRLATGDRAGTAPLGKAGRLPSQPTLSRRVAGWSAKEGARGAARGVAAAGGVAAEGDGRVAAPGDAGHRHRQPAGRGSRGTAGQRLERLLSPARVSSDRGGGGGRRATSWTCGCARGRSTRRTAGWSSSSRCWSGRSGICAGRPPCASTRDIPASR